jgi:roadblock/LC7 domain-containing protein
VLDPAAAAHKVRALAAQATQTARLIAAMGADSYTAWVGNEWFVERALHPTVTTRPARAAVMLE